MDKSTGEIDRQRILSLVTSRIAKEELLDGYYAIVTSEVDLDVSTPFLFPTQKPELFPT